MLWDSADVMCAHPTGCSVARGSEREIASQPQVRCSAGVRGHGLNADAARLLLMNAVGRSNAKHELAKRVAALCRLEGDFMLRSGQTATTYFDKYRFEAEPETLALVASQMAGLVPSGTEILAGLELGGVPVATALSLNTGIPAAFVRKVAKPYGTARLAEGSEISGRRVLVVEDVITTGGQVVASTEELRRLGAVVEAVLCVIDRSGGDHSRLDSIGLETVALFRAGDLA
jgi:orotate phosphoribosyltransferase